MEMKQKIDNPGVKALLMVAHSSGVCGRDRDALLRVARTYLDLLEALHRIADQNALSFEELRQGRVIAYERIARAAIAKATTETN